MNQQQKVQEAA